MPTIPAAFGPMIDEYMAKTGQTSDMPIRATQGPAIVRRNPVSPRSIAKTPSECDWVPEGILSWIPDPARYFDEIPIPSVVVRETHHGEPVPKQRPRFSRRTGHVYTPGSTRDHEKAIAALASGAIGSVEPDAEWSFGIRAVFYVQTHRHKDVDNMLKVVLDGMNRLVFKDDSQVKELMGWSFLDCLNPRTEFIVYRMNKIDLDSGTCVQCGEQFRRYRSWKSRLFCSRKCLKIRAEGKRKVECSECGKSLLRSPGLIESQENFYCSAACRGKHSRVDAVCLICKSPVSRARSCVRPGQTRVFCSQKCSIAGRSIRTGSPPPKQSKSATEATGLNPRPC